MLCNFFKIFHTSCPISVSMLYFVWHDKLLFIAIPVLCFAVICNSSVPTVLALSTILQIRTQSAFIDHHPLLHRLLEGLLSVRGTDFLFFAINDMDSSLSGNLVYSHTSTPQTRIN